MYLFDYNNHHSETKVTINKILGRYNFVPKNFVRNGYITARLDVEDSNEQNLFCISEFPGNCSTLVLHSIQGYSTNTLRQIIDATEEICQAMEYALLFVSGTGTAFSKLMTETFGFSIFLGNIYNPHSGNNNFFFMKRTYVPK